LENIPVEPKLLRWFVNEGRRARATPHPESLEFTMDIDKKTPKAVNLELIRLAYKYGLNSAQVAELITEWNNWVQNTFIDTAWIHRN
jgi:hypothetical protein